MGEESMSIARLPTLLNKQKLPIAARALGATDLSIKEKPTFAADVVLATSTPSRLQEKASIAADVVVAPELTTVPTDTTSVVTAPPPPGLPPKWRWPPWCLNHKKPEIEVYVVDNEKGSSRWCRAEPRVRVVDDCQHDSYLCAEYMWEGEIYLQDFGPHQVRRRGQRVTVHQIYESTTHGATDERLTKAHPLHGLESQDSINADVEDDQPLRRWRDKRSSLLMAKWMVGKRALFRMRGPTRTYTN